MPSTLIRNIGEIFSGDLAAPMVAAESIAIVDGLIDCFDPPQSRLFDIVIDAAGAAVLPGLVDGHVHPVIGEWTPTQNTQGWLTNYLHGGSTTVISAGELHTPGFDPAKLTAELIISLAVVTAGTVSGATQSGIKLHAGTALMIPGLTEHHFDRLAAAGAKLVKFLFYPLDSHRDEALAYTRWVHERGMLVKVHSGGVSRSGASQICGFETLNWLQPDIAAHISGGPIPMSDADQDRVIDETALTLEICSSGNYGSTLRAVRRLAQRQQLARLCMGTDTPGGTGIIPRGMLRNILFLTSVCGLTPGEAVAIGSGNTARAHKLPVGVLAAGRSADLLIAGPVEGSAGSTLSDAIAHGDLPGIACVMIDGRLVVSGRSQQTPPPRLRPVIQCCTR